MKANKKNRIAALIFSVCFSLILYSSVISSSIIVSAEGADDIEFTLLTVEEAIEVRKIAEANREALLSKQLPTRTEGEYSYKNLHGYNTYYYQQMDDGEKYLYDKIVESCELVLNSGADISEPYYFDSIDLKTPLSTSAFKKVIYAAYYSNPQFFFLSNGYSYSLSSGKVISAAPLCAAEYAKGTVRTKAEETINNVTDEWMQEINKLNKDIDKERWISRKLCETITYCKTDYDQTIAGALIYKKCVCNGYAMAMTYFCNLADIQCILVTGNNHAWNIINIDGVWYEVDVTWMDHTDLAYTYINSEWCNKSRSTFLSNDSTSHNIDSKHTGILSIPSCKTDYRLCEEHVWDDYIVTKNPTSTTIGYKFHACSVCIYTEVLKICAGNNHTWSSDYLYNSEYHWKECTICQNITEKSEHNFVNGICNECGIEDNSYAYSIPIDETHFPDDAFRECVADFDVDGDCYLSDDEIERITYFDVSERSIYDLTGIEHFYNLESLCCSNNCLTSIDVSKNNALSSLDCYSNSYEITTETTLSKFTFDLSELEKYGFDVSKASNWIGAEYDESANTLTNFTSKTVTYTYDCGNGYTANFTLKINGNSSVVGDLNGDGNVNNRDLVILRASLADFDIEYSETADINGDGEINNKDLIVFRQQLVQLL